MSSSEMNLMDLLFPREESFLKEGVKDEPFMDHSYGEDAIAECWRNEEGRGDEEKRMMEVEDN